ncbi:MAG TPA: class I SAM-dependent methyltransferase, partial [Fibrobacteria bacterium]|nr:class I SAM-dependent methyltransferase [Fibrobacteria bacterium]
MHPTVQDMGARVRAQYEAYPYPRYSLLLPLRPQEAYASNSLFAARLLESRGLEPAVRETARPGILIAGCGDVFPYMATFWEPRAHRLIAADLSAASLRRARLRCLPRPRGFDWRRGSLEDAGFDLPGGLSHIDCYGVLHHLADPAAALRRLAGLLLPGGTARIMVYNSAARTWIRHLQRGFDLLGFATLGEGDVAATRGLLESLAAASPPLRERLSGMRESLANPARLVD